MFGFFWPHHGTDHPAEVNRVGSQEVVLLHVALVLRADLKQLQTRFQDSRLILGKEGGRVLSGLLELISQELYLG